jgi:RbsD / FucU transport protein family
MEIDTMSKPSDQSASSSWEAIFQSKLPLFGHRNWIVVADSAYPAQSGAGITTVAADADQLEVVREVLSRLASAAHVNPNVYTDRELVFVSERDAPGIDKYRRELGNLLQELPVQTTPHEEIIRKLDSIATRFQVLIIKTRLTIPYSSVFLELDCAYWSADAESRLRAAIKQITGS